MTADSAQFEIALRDVSAAGAALDDAKHAHSAPAISRAEWDLQGVVDKARDLGVKWGSIGVALGIARGNAYQKYRHRQPAREARHVA